MTCLQAPAHAGAPPKIPIRNVWHMLLYAWDLPQFRGEDSLGLDDSPDLPDLMARVLCEVTKAQIRRGLHRDYVDVQEKLRFLRGRVDLMGSARRLELLHGTATCLFDELSHDILANRILRTTLVRLAGRPGLDAGLRQDLRAVVARLPPIAELAVVSDDLFGQIRIARNNARYRLLMQLCRLAWHLRLPTRAPGGDPFAGLLDDGLRMQWVFESFVRHFYQWRQPSFTVSAEALAWPAEGNRTYLPAMRTDISLTRPDRRIVIDTKYYKDTLQERFGHRTVHSGHLYQMFAYLRTQEERGDPYLHAEGMLLYPTAGYEIDEQYRIQGHSMRVTTLDLAVHWTEIENRLQSLI